MQSEDSKRARNIINIMLPFAPPLNVVHTWFTPNSTPVNALFMIPSCVVYLTFEMDLSVYEGVFTWGVL